MTLSAGQKLGPYEILSPAGAGGMGEVYKAKDTRLDRVVAIKILPSHSADNPDLRQRFEREAKAISSLNHPNICTLYDIGQLDGSDYLVMEFIDGETLASRLQQGPLPVAEVLRFATQIADALDRAHRQGLIHRDLKPGNIMLTKEGAKLLDFGLARLRPAGGVVEGVSGITRTTPLTGEGTILGTLQYMAPEQLEGKEADARSDLFAFGAVLYEMATGKRAFDGKSQASLIAAILREEPRSVSQVSPMSPPMLDRVVKQCLEKDPDHRWQSAGDLKRALQWVAEGGSQAGIPLVVSKRRKTRDWILSAVAACSLLAAGFFAWTNFVTARVPKTAVRTIISSPETASFNLLSYSQFAISPDGRSIAFVALDSGSQNLNLWVRPLNSYVAMKLPGTAGAFHPFWSPDSKYIAYAAGPPRQQGLWVMQLNTRSHSQLIPPAEGANYWQLTFSPDGD
ncbi:MAG: serine/threonine-protein kinase, partial [candidate division Zixibacteria bacterium]|nr:serine/threonine-protein kinase [candidate division Zixibacteria bacterium]